MLAQGVNRATRGSTLGHPPVGKILEQFLPRPEMFLEDDLRLIQSILSDQKVSMNTSGRGGVVESFCTVLCHIFTKHIEFFCLYSHFQVASISLSIKKLKQPENVNISKKFNMLSKNMT